MRRVKRKVASKDKGKEVISSYIDIDDEGSSNVDEPVLVDWTSLPDDTAIHLLSFLNCRDRASLFSTCNTWRCLGFLPCLWQKLDLRAHKFTPNTAKSLSSRCSNLQKLRFRGGDSADAIIFLKARNLKEISGDYCRKISDSTLSMLVARHEALESLQLGPDFCENVSSDAIKKIAFSCSNLKKLRLSGIKDVNMDAINEFTNFCPYLTDIGFIDCMHVDVIALGKVVSLEFLSVAGTMGMNWSLVSEHWSKLPNLKGLDLSRTSVLASTFSTLFSSSPKLKAICALNCPGLEQEPSFSSNLNKKDKLLLFLFSDIFKELASSFADMTKNERNVLLDWRNSKIEDKNLEELMEWLEWVLSHSLLRIAESNPQGLDNFWLNQGAELLLSLMQSSQEDVRERATTGLATFVVIDEENARVDGGRAETVMKNGGIRLLLDMAKSWHEGLQTETARAIANLSVNANVANSIAEKGGITVLANLSRSRNRFVAEEAAGGLWNLSVGEEHKGAVAEAGGLKALVDLIYKWSSDGDGVLERAAGALANLAADDKCSMEIAVVGGVRALVMLARTCKIEGVQEQAARALANLAAHGDSNSNNSIVGQEAGSLDALVQLIRSPNDGVRQEAAGALWNLAFDDRNRETIAAAGGVEALVALARSCSNASLGLQERAAGALWGLSVSEENSIAIGQEGGVAPLIALARSDSEDVHETAAGALWNLSYNAGNALRIVEGNGVPALVQLCSSSPSRMARFMATLALAYMFDRRMDEFALVGTSTGTIFKNVNFDGNRRMAFKHIEAFIHNLSNPSIFNAAILSSSPILLSQVTELSRIHEAGHLRCSGEEIGRFVVMLRNPCSVLKTCAAFALFQFTIPGGRHAIHHVNLLQNAGAQRVLRAAAAATTAPIEAKIFSRIVLRNLEHHQKELKLKDRLVV